ncbi:hypothetical protein [Paenibacillus herberti]|uniref:Uncharacterized protein n=1 Tax=Paenibacillus herberti TaxID=1619309 RepID=A0A229P373_9BACL|nr:hypothetical protein [Paenibacillus herberti]OXM16568.1 hypothetical protein CGZ75_07865 [Paenibacillus herberti]
MNHSIEISKERSLGIVLVLFILLVITLSIFSIPPTELGGQLELGIAATRRFRVVNETRIYTLMAIRSSGDFESPGPPIPFEIPPRGGDHNFEVEVTGDASIEFRVEEHTSEGGYFVRGFVEVGMRTDLFARRSVSVTLLNHPPVTYQVTDSSSVITFR